MVAIHTFDPKKDKMVFVGYTEGSKFHRVVLPEHYMRKYGGYGQQVDVVERWREQGIKKVYLREMASGDTLISNVEDWTGPHSIKETWGHGPQYFLPAKFMQRVQKG